MHIRPFQAVFPVLEYITSADSFFNTVKEEYPDYYESGFFNKSSQDALYIYQIKQAARTFTGILASAAIQDYLEGHIKKHEHTLADKEQKQLQLLLRRKATVKPVLLTYPSIGIITEWISKYAEANEPFLSVQFESDGQVHQVWEIRDGQEIRLIQDLFEKHVPNAYIADGHHRTSTTALMHQRMQTPEGDSPFDLLLCAFFPASEIEILDFNRVVDGLENLPVSVFMGRLAALFDIKILREAAKPTRKHELTMCLEKHWFRLRWRKKVLRRYNEEEVLLDTMLFNELVLRDILGIENVRDDLRIQYIEGPKGADGVEKKAIKSPTTIGFCLPPVTLEELMHIADANLVLPPKSTWFEPRMKNGLIVKDYK